MPTEPSRTEEGFRIGGGLEHMHRDPLRPLDPGSITNNSRLEHRTAKFDRNAETPKWTEQPEIAPREDHNDLVLRGNPRATAMSGRGLFTPAALN